MPTKNDYDYYDTQREIKVYETINQSEKDITVQEIADELDLNRDTVTKYVKVLYHTGRLNKTRNVGNAIFYDTK